MRGCCLSYLRPLLVCFGVLISSSGMVAAHVPVDHDAVFLPEVTIVRALEQIQVDGNLSDPGWRAAAPITSFVERYPGDNSRPPVETRVSVTYDDKHLYVAFVCLDDPQNIRASMCERDQFSEDDAVAVMLDTYGDASWAYEFFVNPYGVQKDMLWTRIVGEDPGFDLMWHSAARITDSGYQAELAIPFSSMRFPNGAEQSWKIDFQRIHPRETSRRYAWAAYDRDEQCGPCQWGTLGGINGVEPGRGLEILPSYIAHQSSQLSDPADPTSGISDDDLNGELSVGAKYRLSSSATLEGTYNPDFSQIESDAAQVDVNTTLSLFYPERRPFFQEGADIFRTLFNSFYTRTVNDPEYAVKMISRSSGFTIGVMSAQDETTPYMVPLSERSELFNAGRSWVNVVRGTRSFGDASQVGFIVTDRRLEGGGYGSIVALDGDLRLSQTYNIDGQVIASFTGEPDNAGQSGYLDGVPIDDGAHTAVFDGEEFSGNAFIARLRRASRTWSFVLDYNQVDPSYRTLTGYDPWVDYRHVGFHSNFRFYPKSGIFQRVTPSMVVESRFSYDGVRRFEFQEVGLSTSLTWAQTNIGFSIGRGSQNWTSRVSGQLVPYKDLLYTGIDIHSRPSNNIGYYLHMGRDRSVARLAETVGIEKSVELGVTLKPMDRLQVQPNITHVRSTDTENGRELFRQFISRTRIDYQVSRALSLRLVVQYNDSKTALYQGQDAGAPSYNIWSRRAWDIDPLLTYRLSSFSVIHAGSTHDYGFFPANDRHDDQWQLATRQFFLKIQYLFQT